MTVQSHNSVRLSGSLLTLILGSLQALMPLSTDLYLPALPAIAHGLGVSAGAAQLTVAIFIFGVAIGQIVYGPITDKFGRKRPLLIGLAVYVLGAGLCALAPTINLLIAGRFVQAIGASSSAVITAAVVRDLWSGKAMADRLSMLMLVVGFAPIVAPSLGGLMLMQWDWRGLFWFLVLCGSLIIAAVTLLPETSSAQERMQVRLRDAIRTYIGLTKNKVFMLYALTGACLSAVLIAYITGAAFMYIEALGIAPSLFAIVFGFGAFGFIAATQLNRLFLKWTSLIKVTQYAVSATLILSLVLVGIISSGHLEIVTVTAVLFALQFSLGFTFPNIAAIAFESVQERMGSASALQGMIQSVISGLSGGLVGTLSNGAVLPMTGIMAGFAVVAAILLVVSRRAQPDNQAQRM